MKISSKGLTFIKSFEGCSLTAYQDSGGVWTIGYGSLTMPDGSKVKKGDKITKTEATALLENKIKEYYPTQKAIQSHFDSLTSYHYNCGKYAKEDWKSRNNVIRDMRGNELPGLIRRRIAELGIWWMDDYTTSKPAWNLLNKIEVKSYYINRGFKYEHILFQWILFVFGFKTDRDGYLGNDSERQIKAYQKSRGLVVDGIIGKNTIAQMKKDLLKHNLY